MNIFKNMEGLFIGPSPEHIIKYANDFWKLAGKLRADLGEKGYYLDQYLSNIFEVMARFDLLTIGEIASNMCWSILGDCYILCGPDEKKEKSEFFDIVKNYIEKYNVDFSEIHAKAQFYAANIVVNHLNVLYDKVKHVYSKNVLSYIDYPVSNGMYKQISSLVGERRMEILNESMCEAFVFSPTMVSAVQQIVTRGFQMLCYRDPESSKQLYQFMLEEKFNG